MNSYETIRKIFIDQSEIYKTGDESWYSMVMNLSRFYNKFKIHAYNMHRLLLYTTVGFC